MILEQFMSEIETAIIRNPVIDRYIGRTFKSPEWVPYEQAIRFRNLSFCGRLKRLDNYLFTNAKLQIIVV